MTLKRLSSGSGNPKPSDVLSKKKDKNQRRKGNLQKRGQFGLGNQAVGRASFQEFCTRPRGEHRWLKVFPAAGVSAGSPTYGKPPEARGNQFQVLKEKGVVGEKPAAQSADATFIRREDSYHRQGAKMKSGGGKHGGPREAARRTSLSRKEPVT